VDPTIHFALVAGTLRAGEREQPRPDDAPVLEVERLDDGPVVPQEHRVRHERAGAVKEPVGVAERAARRLS
jgi:hypothetical protein